MSVSSDARIWSKFTVAWVWLAGMTQSSGASPACAVPGSSWIVMSFSPVLGRTSAVAFLYSVASSRWIFIVTTARPFSRSTLPISPTLTPAIATSWPWPGISAWAVEISILRSTKSDPSTGTQAGR